MVKLKPEELQVGDVLLCRGKDWISKLISWLGGGPYSHATIYVGKRADTSGKEDGYIAEADFEGISYMTLEKIRRDEKFADVYRFKKNGHVMGDPELPPDPILKVADGYITAGNKYAFDHLLLLALLAFTYKVNPLLKWLLRPLLDRATALLFTLIDTGRHPMVCSEFTYRCFAEAKPRHKYEIEVTDGSAAPQPTALQSSLLEQAPPTDGTVGTALNTKSDERRDRFLEAWNKASPGPGAHRSDGSRKLAALMMTPSAASLAPEHPAGMEAFLPPVPSCVTPYDLQTSPDLVLVGRLVFP
jgi:hypothetical protein